MINRIIRQVSLKKIQAKSYTRQFIFSNKKEVELPLEYKTHKIFDRNAEFENPINLFVKPAKRLYVGGWLLLCAAGVYYMVLLGGYTRLTHSGLSMTRWRPIEYTYPTTEQQWQKEFDHYQQFPEYNHNPQQVSLEKFQKIYLVEYLHRISGSALGALYVIPLTAFSALKWITPKFSKRLGLIGLLGLSQGLIGWWMVKSGLNQPKPTYQTKPRVSTYRLCVHLSTAITLYSLLIWNAMTVLRQPNHLQINPENYQQIKRMRHMGISLIVLLSLNIFSGALMAGIDAGKVYNTWPSMNGAIVPDGLFKLSPLWKNYFENVTLVQFNHRGAAYLTYGLVTYIAYQAYIQILPRQIKLSAFLVLFLVNYQLLTGIQALLNQVPVHSGSIHQFNALNTLTASLLLLHCARKPSKIYRLYLKQFK